MVHAIPHPFVAWRPGFTAILRFKGEGAGPWCQIEVWQRRQWTDFGGATPVISDVSNSALAVAQRWRARNPATWDELHRAPPLWIVVKADGCVELTEFEPPADELAMRVRDPSQEDAYALLRFPAL
jgi:hypothetical protein